MEEIAIVANTDGFKASLQRGIAPGIRGMVSDVKAGVAQTAGAFDEIGMAAGEALKGVDYSDAFSELVDEIDDIESDLAAGLTGAGKKAAAGLVDEFDGTGRQIAQQLDVDDEFSRMTRELRDEASRAAQGIEQEFSGVADSIGDELDKIDDTNFGDGLRDAARQLADRLPDEFDGVGDEISDEIERGADFGPGIISRVRQTATRMADEFRRVPDALRRSVDDIEDDLNDGLRDAGRRAAESLVDEFDGLGAEIGRELQIDEEFDEAGERMRRSATDVIRDLVSSFRRGSDDIEDDLRDIGDIQIGDGLRREADALATDLAGEFDGVAEEISTKLNRIGDQLTIDEEFARITARLKADATETASEIETEFTDAASEIESELKSIDAVGLKDLEGEASSVARRVVDQFNGVAREIENKLSTGADFGTGLVEDAKSVARRVANAFDGKGKEIGKDLASGIVDALKEVPKIAAGIGIGAGVALGAGVLGGIGREGITDRVAGSLGLSPQEAEELGRVAGELYSNAYGDSFEGVSAVIRDAIAVEVPKEQLEEITALVFSMESAFGGAAQEYLTLTGQLRNQGVIDDISSGLDLLVASYQQLPSELADPLNEALKEYAIFADQLGFSTEEVFTIFVNAAKKGEFQLDKTGDALKEFTFLSTDLSTNSVAAFEAIGLSAEDMANMVLAGGDQANEALNMIIDGLLAMEDPAQRANTAIALFGSPLEELTVKEIPEFLEGLRDVEGGLGDVEGKAKEVDSFINENFATTFTEFKRTAGLAFSELATAFIGPALEEIQPYLDRFADWMRDEGPEAAEKIREAVTPAWENLRDALEDVDWQAVLDTISEALENIDWEGIAEDVANFAESVRDFDWEGFAEDVVGAAEAVATMADAIATLIGYSQDVQGFFDSLPGDTANPIAPWKDTIFDIIGSLGDIEDKLGELKDDWGEDWDEIKSVAEGAKGVVGEIADDWREDWDEIKRALGDLRDDWGEDWDEIERATTTAVEAVGRALSDMKTAFEEDWEEIKEVAGDIGTAISEGFGELKDDWEADWEEIKGFATDAADEITAKYEEDWEELKAGAADVAGWFETKFGEAADFIEDRYGDAEQLFSGILNYDYSGLFTGIGEAIVEARDDLGERLGEMLEDTRTWAEDTRASISDKLTEIRTEFTNKYTEYRDIAADKFEEIRSTVVDKLQGLRDDAVGKYEELKTATTDKFEEIRTAISDKLTEIKNDTIGWFTDQYQQWVGFGNNLLQILYDMGNGILTIFTETFAAGFGLVSGFKDDVTVKWEEMQVHIQNKTTEAKDWVLGELGKIRDLGAAAATEAKTLISTPFVELKDLLTGLFTGIDLGTPGTSGVGGALGTLITTIDSLIKKIQELFGITVKLEGVASNLAATASRSTGPFYSSRSTGGFREPNSGASTGGQTGIFDDGGLAIEPGIVALDFNPELVLPLTKRDRMKALLSEFAGDLAQSVGGPDELIQVMFGGRPTADQVQQATGGVASLLRPEQTPFVDIGAGLGQIVSETARGQRTTGTGYLDQSRHETHNHFYGVEAGTVAKQQRDREKDLIKGLRVRP